MLKIKNKFLKARLLVSRVSSEQHMYFRVFDTTKHNLSTREVIQRAIGRNSLDFDRLNSPAEPNQTQSNGFSWFGSICLIEFDCSEIGDITRSSVFDWVGLSMPVLM